MTEYGLTGKASLPNVSEKDLIEMNSLLSDKAYRIKEVTPLFRAEKNDFVSSEFILYTLNDYLGHVQRCVAATKKMLPPSSVSSFYVDFAQSNPIAFNAVSITADIDIKNLGLMLLNLQKAPREVTLEQLIPFIRTLFQSLIKIYYLGSTEVTHEYRIVYTWVLQTLIPSDTEGFKSHVADAISEWQFILNKIIPALYPLLLRLCSSSMQSMSDLFYKNGSKLLNWLYVNPSEVLLIRSRSTISNKPVIPEVIEDEDDPLPEISDDVKQGLKVLESLFPEAGWSELHTYPDLCPYFLSLISFHDAFTQLAPDNPMHPLLIISWVLEELFQGLRQIKFEALAPQTFSDDTEDINKILEEWILYHEQVFDKTFSNDLKEYTHQIYTQPDFHKNPYGRKLLSNMYTLIKSMFLPHFNIQMYGTARIQKDDRFPPFYTRVRRLRRLLERYNESIESASPFLKNDEEGSIPGLLNPWAPYKFDIPNSVSKRLDALCGGKGSKNKTNAILLQYILSIVHVLDWWVNDKNSYAYINTPQYLYRVVEEGSQTPAFGVTARNDIEALFIKHLKNRS